IRARRADGSTWAAWLRARVNTVRIRTTVAAVVVVGVAMAVGAVVLVAALRTTLTRGVRTAASLRAADVAAVLESGTGPGGLAVGGVGDLLIQVLDESGAVIASSPNVEGQPPVAPRLRPGESAEVDVPVDDDSFLAVAVAADTPDGRLTVVVARTVDPVSSATSTVTGLLAAGLPALLLVVAATTWRVVGRALAPVEAIRNEVDEISAAELHRRVPTPPGNDEIARLAVTMNRMLGRIERAQIRQRRFISDASHELRSPVASIRQHAEVALAHPDRTTTAELAGTVLAEDLRVQRLIDDLLLLARADEHTLQLRWRPVDLDDLVFAEARRLRDTTDLRVDTTAVSAGRVHGDTSGLRRVLRNLSDNAARHAHGRINLALAERDGTVFLAVDDDGSGIPEAERERVFERFVRLDDARSRDEGGSGLGLAIVSELVAAHGGTVVITDSSLGGARIEVSLPGVGEPGD
ncbi:MAG: sensor histidine kinase, partial [Egibacteraceae bacterium]